jgi:hypothetical protein
MARWTPTEEGWVTRLGGGWQKSHWKGRQGLAFRAEAHSRAFLYNNDDAIFTKITLLECMAVINKENRLKAEENRYNPSFFWSNLLIAQCSLLSQQTNQSCFERGPPPGKDGKEFPSKIGDFIMSNKGKVGTDRRVEILSDGSIRIPVCAFERKNCCLPMHSFEGGGQVLLQSMESQLELNLPGTTIL